jgi:hypothetical protein
MNEPRLEKRSAKQQLRLYVPVRAAPQMEGAARAVVVRLLARLLSSAVQELEASDETY